MATRCRYVVLRDANTKVRQGRSFSLDGILRGFSEVPPEPRVEADEMAPREAQRLAQDDPEVLGVARAMPTRLIEPRNGGEIDPDAVEGGAAWGVSAVGGQPVWRSGREGGRS